MFRSLTTIGLDHQDVSHSDDYEANGTDSYQKMPSLVNTACEIRLATVIALVFDE